jgi:hypothetical protein
VAEADAAVRAFCREFRDEWPVCVAAGHHCTPEPLA